MAVILAGPRALIQPKIGASMERTRLARVLEVMDFHRDFLGGFLLGTQRRAWAFGA